MNYEISSNISTVRYSSVSARWVDWHICDGSSDNKWSLISQINVVWAAFIIYVLIDYRPATINNGVHLILVSLGAYVASRNSARILLDLPCVIILSAVPWLHNCIILTYIVDAEIVSATDAVSALQTIHVGSCGIGISSIDRYEARGDSEKDLDFSLHYLLYNM